MKNYYQVLGVRSSATSQEIRRAYRILARRYHPDLNPGKTSEDKFKLIAEAYAVLGDDEQRRRFDAEFSGTHDDARAKAAGAYKRNVRDPNAAKKRFYESQTSRERQAQEPAPARTTKQASQLQSELSFIGHKIGQAFRAGLSRFATHRSAHSNRSGVSVNKLAIHEISIGMREALLGGRKTVELQEGDNFRKLSLNIPAGIKNGSVLRMRSKGDSNEELVFIVRLPQHPFLSIQNKGLVVELPVSVKEAICGASITVPTLDEPVVLKVPAGSQTGLELRLKERGISLNNGVRGDLFYRLLIRVPTAAETVGLKEKSIELEKFYETSVRQDFPKNLLEEYERQG